MAIIISQSKRWPPQKLINESLKSVFKKIIHSFQLLKCEDLFDIFFSRYLFIYFVRFWTDYSIMTIVLTCSPDLIIKIVSNHWFIDYMFQLLSKAYWGLFFCIMNDKTKRKHYWGKSTCLRIKPDYWWLSSSTREQETDRDYSKQLLKHLHFTVMRSGTPSVITI